VPKLGDVQLANGDPGDPRLVGQAGLMVSILVVTGPLGVGGRQRTAPGARGSPGDPPTRRLAADYAPLVTNELPAFAFAWRGPLRDALVAADYRGWLGDPDFTVNDDTPVVLQRFRVITED